MGTDKEHNVSWHRKLLLALRSTLPRGDLPGAQQDTPFNLNRYALLFLYVLQTFVTGCVYFGWAPLSAMLLRAGVFSFKCGIDENGSFVDDQRQFGNNYICDKQDASVQSLFVITLATHCTMSAVAGAMMDTLGPKITSMIGQCFHIIAWSLISTLTEESNERVYLGFIFLGLGADTAFLPTLLITRLFPGAAATVITLIGSASSASFAIPLILNSYLTNNGISGCWWYVGFGPCLFLLVDAFSMPLKAFKVIEDDLTGSQGCAQTDQQALSQSPHISKQETGELNSPAERSSSNAVKHQQTTTGQTFKQTLFSETYLLVVTYFTAVGWITSFYQEAHDRILEATALKFLGNALPFSFIPCIILGKLSEAIVFVYIEENFPAKFFGRLIGIVQLVGGLLSLLCSPLFHLTVGLGPKGMYVVQLPMIGLLLLMYVVLARMWWIHQRCRVSQERENDHVAAAESAVP
ncbi:hypothetical protein, conserved [Eimeria maxima]|uniref:Uncharacterized protein n=1 Tax=Eimeria maxima TaxID=5804 RepID=U6M5W0_EIMMA|nr:hypothetical protein, conserved [Eimeria maxima]CDJ58463.1 hypothetical protein, conserved [Eimeria maxima]